jgi:ubiquinone/menaquinone biosynthesis C-methylase UbiE
MARTHSTPADISFCAAEVVRKSGLHLLMFQTVLPSIMSITTLCLPGIQYEYLQNGVSALPEQDAHPHE